nr:MAG TPA: Protein of unknown function (DUF1492) [Caudoviricetes sp.]
MKKSAFLKDFEEELRIFSYHEENVKSINEELEIIDNKIYNVKNANPTSYSTGKGNDTNSIEEKLINLLARQDRLSKQLISIENEYLRTKSKLSCLTADEYRLIELRYFKNYKLEKMEKILFKDKSNISRDLDRVLFKILERQYGKIV